MILSHYSREPLELDAARLYEQPERESKPRGLWLSDDSDFGWREWCEAEDFNLGGIRHRSCWQLDTSRVLVLSTPQQLFEFTERFRNPHPGMRFISNYCLNWAEVAGEWGGILITPYQWSARLDDRVSWYYGWDCASACVWDLSLVRRVY